jgi:phosphoglycolate phosphatase
MLLELGGGPLEIDEITRMVGDGAAVLVTRALSRAGLDPRTPGALDTFLARYGERLIAHTRPYPGIPEALAALRAQGRTLAVLTNKPQDLTARVLDLLGLSAFFSDARGGDTPAGRKPHPAGLLQIAERAGAAPSSTVLVGDSPVDMETARRAGTQVCLARYGFGYRFDPDAFRGDEMFVDTPAELPDRLARIPTNRS